MAKEDNLFPEKDLIDMKFMDLLKYGNIEIKDKTEVDKALHEYSLLIYKAKELDAAYNKLEVQLISKHNDVASLINEAKNSIENNIEKYYSEHFTDLSFQPREDNDSSRATLQFEHGEIIVTHKSKTDFKIKPTKP